ncbi:MAG TPA: hypothetical protein VJR95_02425 [Rhodanobacter sp.]|nr:hypothetical protein [Rhodanobacter sp.]
MAPIVVASAVVLAEAGGACVAGTPGEDAEGVGAAGSCGPFEQAAQASVTVNAHASMENFIASLLVVWHEVST